MATKRGMIRRTSRRAFEGLGRARRRSGPALARAKDAALAAGKRARKYAKEVKDPMEAAKHSGLVLAGSAASGYGSAKGWIPDTIMDIDSDPILGIALGAAGFALKRKELVYLGTGFLAPYVAEYARTL